jgi:hypothetical protein
MSSSLLRASLLLIASVLVSASAHATTYYIAASGSDSSNGTSKTTPWLHAPGMTGCAATCGSTTPRAGDQFILRGGDTWHTSSGTPTGIPWSWSWSGTSASPIYVGVDKAWFSGASWSRPVLNRDNPLSTSFVSSCAHDDSTFTSVNLSGSYVTFDNFELTGQCIAGNASSPDIRPSGNHITMSNLYFHGWTATSNSVDSHWMIQHATNAITYNVVAYSVFDGSDSSRGTTASECAKSPFGPPCQSGFAIYEDAYEIHHNVFRYLSNGWITLNTYSAHDNLFEYMWNTYDGQTHPNVAEWGPNSSPNLYFYNNVVRYTQQAVTYWPTFDTAGFEFNNVFFANTLSAANCFMQSPATSAGSPTAYIFNNTFDTGCLVQFYPGNSATPAWNNSPAYFQNNHYINYSSPQLSSTYAGKGTVHDNGGHIFQSEATANGQGYTPGNNYAPTSPNGSTVAAAVNATAWCDAMADVNAQAACKHGAPVIGYDSANHMPIVSATTPVRPGSGAWDSGAYMFGPLTTTAPAAPSGLVAVPR